MLLALPPEIIVQILCDLHPYDYLSCQLTCKHLHDLITHSSELQYYAALLPALAEDNPCSNLPVAEKLEALRRSENAWSALRPGFTMSVPVTHVQSGIYDLTAGVYFLGNSTRNAIHYLKLPSKETDEVKWEKLDVDKTIIDIGLCLYEHDLIVIVTSTPIQQHAALRPVYQIELQLVEFSTGNPHPAARESRIRVMNSQWEKPAVGIETVGDNLVLILSFNTAQRPEDRVFIYEWKTNTLKTSWVAPFRSYSGFLFLTEHLILIPNTHIESLDILRIPPKATFDTPTPLLVLKLPGLGEGRVLGSISTRSEPNPIGANSRLGGRGSDPKRAFLAKAEDAICIFDLRVLELQMVLLPGGGLNMNFQFRHRFTFVTHRKALVALVERYGRKERDVEKPEEEGRHGDKEEGEQRRDGEMDEGQHGEDRMEEDEVAHSLEETQDEAHSDNSGSTPRLRSVSPSSAASSASSDHNPASSSFSPGPPTLSYSLWGPSLTRWFNSDDVSTHWITTTAGQRCVQMEDAPPGRDVPVVVLDFNPARVKERKRRVERRERERLEEALRRAAEREKRAGLDRAGAEQEDGGGSGRFVSEAEGGGEHWEEGPVVHLRIPGRFTPPNAVDDDEMGDMVFDRQHRRHRDDEDQHHDVEVEDEEEDLQDWRHYHDHLRDIVNGDSDSYTPTSIHSDAPPSNPSAGPSTSSSASAFTGHERQSPVNAEATFGDDRHSHMEEEEGDGAAAEDAREDGDDEVQEGDEWDMDMDMAWGASDEEELEDANMEPHDLGDSGDDLDSDSNSGVSENDLPPTSTLAAAHHHHHHHLHLVPHISYVDPTSSSPLSHQAQIEEHPGRQEDDDDRTWVVTSVDQLQPAETFAEPVLGGLPYVACATAEGYSFDGVLLDEERVLGLKTNLTDHIERIEILHFG